MRSYLHVRCQIIGFCLKIIDPLSFQPDSDTRCPKTDTQEKTGILFEYYVRDIDMSLEIFLKIFIDTISNQKARPY
jgi:hypothetical protein